MPSDPPTQPDPSPHNPQDPRIPPVQEPIGFPAVASPKPPDEAAGAVRTLSKSGRLPGYEPSGLQAFSSQIFGGLYDHTLHATIEPAPSGSGSTVRGEIRINKKMPAVVLAATVLTIWPGVWLFHSLLTTYFGWYPRADWVTWAWYVPLCLISLPVLWKQFKQGRLEARVHAGEIAERIRAAVEGTFTDAPSSS